jgi:hypothetical protein
VEGVDENGRAEEGAEVGKEVVDEEGEGAKARGATGDTRGSGNCYALDRK